MARSIRFFLLTAMLAATVSAVYFGKRIVELKEECSRLEQNQLALSYECDTLTLANGKHVAKVMELELTAKELQRLCSMQAKTINELGIKNKHLQHVISTASSTSVEIDTLVSNNVVYEPTLSKMDTIKVWSWQDNWVRANGILNGDRVQAKFESRDTLHIIAHRVPKRFWFIRYGTKYIELDVVSSNPHTKLVYAKSIKLRKHD